MVVVRGGAGIGAVGVALCFLAAMASVVDSYWVPPPEVSWQWVLSTASVTPIPGVQVYDVDLFDVDAATVKKLKASGPNVHVFCYMSAGTYENWRPDASSFPSSVLGNSMSGWAGERYLDIRAIDKLAPIYRARLDLCKSKGFDGVEPDNIDTYQAQSGFPLTHEHALTYDKWLANEAHTRGLSIGQKNDPDSVPDLVSTFDWGLTEECSVQHWCSKFEPYVTANKAVFQCEYTDTSATVLTVCPESRQLKFSGIIKGRDLDNSRTACGGGANSTATGTNQAADSDSGTLLSAAPPCGPAMLLLLSCVGLLSLLVA